MNTAITTLNPFEEKHLELTIGENNIGRSFATKGFNEIKDKKKLFNYINEKGIPFEEIINKKIDIAHIYIEVTEIVNDNEEVIEVPRTVLIDKDGNSYSGASFGIYNSLKKLIMIFGEPSEKNIISVEFKQVKKGQKSIYTLKAI